MAPGVLMMDDMGASARPIAAQETDALLVERATRGDDRAFATLYSRHVRYVAGVVYRVLGGDEELEDIVLDGRATVALLRPAVGG